MKKLSLFICSLFLFYSIAFGAKNGPGNKFGANYNVIGGASYTLSSKSDTTVSDSDSGNIIGAVLLYENVLSSKFAWGLKYGPGLIRNMELEVGGTTLNIEETTSYWLLDVKAYQKDHISGGLKPFLAVGYGSMTVKSAITTTTATTTETTETKATIPITTLTGGIDYFMDAGGFRLEAGLITGEKSDLESHDDYTARYQMTGSFLNIGVFWLF